MFDSILGHILFWMRFTDLHGVSCSFPLTRYTLRRWHICYLIMILQWSLFGAIQLGPRFLTLRCHHASHFKRYIFDLWVWFCYGRGWLGPHIWWWVTWCHLTFQPVTHLISYWGIFHFRSRFVNPHWFAWSLLVTRYKSSWWFDFILLWFSNGAFLESFSQTHTF